MLPKIYVLDDVGSKHKSQATFFLEKVSEQAI